MSQTYDSSHYEKIDRIERRHFWFLNRSMLLEQVIRSYIPVPHNSSFLEVGFGTGIVLRLLDSMGFNTTGIDVNARALLYAKRKTHATLIRQSIYTCKAKQHYDSVGAFDVMEHQVDDRKFLLCCKQLLKKNGYLFLTVPAGPYLWSQYDELSGHKKRYTKPHINALVSSCGFHLDYCTYWQTFILPFYWLTRKFAHIAGQKKDLMEHVYLKIPIQPLHFLLYALGWLEVKLLSYMSFPYGASLVVVCRKKEGV